MESTHTSHDPNLLTAIIFAIAVASLLIIITFFTFIKSSSYTTVKQIQAGAKVSRSIQNSDIDTRSPIKGEDIDIYQKGVDQRLRTIDDSSDFGPTDVSDQALGLTQ